MSAQPFSIDGRDVEVAVRAIERAWCAGDAAAALTDDSLAAVLDEGLLESYRNAIGKGPRPAFRDSLLAQVFDELRRRSGPPIWTFPAEGHLHLDRSESDFDTQTLGEVAAPVSAPRSPRLAGLSVHSEWGCIAVRIEQATAARRWGVWYALGEVTHQQLLDVALDLSQARWLAHVVAFINRLPPHFLADRLVMTSDGTGASFERLVLDILNEEGRIARHAPFDEDVFEKTDLRVQVPGLERKRGARVQVTLVTEPSRLGQKLEKVRHRDEVVIVSPYTLALGVWGMAGTRSFPREDTVTFFDALGTSVTSPEALALTLKTIFLRAMSEPGTPLGPMLRVPAPVRRWVRAYVVARAHDTTSQLRARQRSGGRTIPASTPVKRRPRG